MDLPAMTVTFDDGQTFTVQAKPRDMARAERDGLVPGSPRWQMIYSVALAGLRRMQAAGEVPVTLAIPATFEMLQDLADVEIAAPPKARARRSTKSPS